MLTAVQLVSMQKAVNN